MSILQTIETHQKILVIGAGEYQLLLIRLTELGEQVFCLDGNPNALGLKLFSGAVCDIENEKACLEIAKKIKPKAVMSLCTDVSLRAVSAIAEQLDLPGISPVSVDLTTNKVHMKMAFLENKVLTAPFEIINKLQSIYCDAPQLFPCSDKPCKGAGSRGVRYLKNKQQLCEYIEDAKGEFKGPFLFEKFIEGIEFAADGFVIDGKVYVLAFTEKKRTHPPVLMDVELTLPIEKDPKWISKASKLVKKVTKALQINNSPFHLEFIDSGGALYAVECASRGAGFNVFSRIIPKVSGVNTLDVSIQLAVGEKA